MSSDLMKEFGSPQEASRSQPQGQCITRGTIPEEDDFGDFEDPGSGEIGVGLHKEAHDGPFQESSIEQVAGHPDIDEDWGDINDYDDQLVFFDADQEMKTQSIHTEKPQVSQHQSPSPLMVSLAPIPEKRVPRTSIFNHSETETPINISQDPIAPVKAPVASVNATVEPKPGFVAAKSTDIGPPPSNIPPPSVLLPLAATLFQSMSNTVKKAAESEHASSDPSEPLDQPRMQQIQTTLSDTRASARVMAGRKLRWKRDNILSQSMKIGPATARTSGMKLAGVDKAETRREDQEAAEALRVWKQQVGPLRSTISMVNVHLPGSGLVIPDMADVMPIRVIRPNEGAVTAPKCCFLCGIKRDERVAKVDVDVEDSFGEWWREHWGHVDCVAFWSRHKDSLRQR